MIKFLSETYPCLLRRNFVDARKTGKNRRPVKGSKDWIEAKKERARKQGR